ncbi:MAG: RsmB/NOP family class I SAM-dependent RNA methyltransferase [Rhodobiaceae bacterium]|nr:RsmB/NOP family class I SAM-dependent RNA methyltransferase [Rhodobiaceae bacterium]MCC0018192.1 RsmB/NOP family class I SAM-dependent RNA methyltransferase [Rhodobiaceae bacterium]MCC0041680.1 RsmB/NOP family class I SAM-dependent RNA methyltransferase [Rhodobiaceae bacterium]
MRDAGRIAAAAEVLDTIATRHRPAADVLRDWGHAHRFAGSGDRAAIGNLVFDALRRRASIAWCMQADTGRALALGAYALVWGNDLDHVEVALASDRHSDGPLSDDERTAIRRCLSGTALDDAPEHVRGDYPEWLDPAFETAFGGERAEEGAGLSQRAPVDLRVNTLKTDRAKALKALARFAPEPTPFSPFGLRVAVGSGPARAPNIQADAAYQRGRIEVQDEASQLAAILALDPSHRQIGDLCAGGGGKTLALAALTANKGQIYAYDADANRLAPIHARLQRAGVRNTQVLPSASDALDGLAGKFDLAFVDAPCTGTGVWRRRPDAKWRLSEGALAERLSEQATVLDMAAPTLKPGGTLVYATCSLLSAENSDQVKAFLERHPGFEVLDVRDLVPARLGAETGQQLLAAARVAPEGLTLSPHRTGTDGFFVSILRRTSG